MRIIEGDVIMKSLIYSMGFALFIFLSGCTHSVTMNPNISPTAAIARPVDLRVGLYIPGGVRSYVISDSQDIDKYVFQIGESLESIITESTTRVFSHIAVLEAHPTDVTLNEQDLDLAIVPRVLAASVSLDTEEGLFQDEARGTTTISVELSFYDSEMISFTTVIANGVGNASQKKGFFSGSFLGGSKEEYAASVENALSSLSNDLVMQVFGNYDIRKKGDESD